MAWFRRERPLRWAVVVASPSGEAGDQWGDTWFGRDLVEALTRHGQKAKLVYRGGASSEARDEDDVVLVLRGLRQVSPRRAGNTWLLWVISAGARDAIAAGVPLGVYGVGWSEFIDAQYIRGEFLPNAEVPAAYAAAGMVLNDHWPEMAADGFLSNRLFDAVASGARVVSDEAAGLREVFGDAVVTYSTPEQLRDILHAPFDTTFPDHERRIANAERIAQEHGFDARAAQLISAAHEMRGSR
mgnify:CR=1 FL=1